MRRIHVTIDARARMLKAGVLLAFAAALIGIAAQSATHPEQLAGQRQSISIASSAQ
jgi:hypothetical protein